MSAPILVAGAVLLVLLCILIAGCFALTNKLPEPESRAGSVADPMVARMDLRQRAYGKRLRREGRTLLAGKEYIPTMTKPQPAKPPKADRVVSILRVKK